MRGPLKVFARGTAALLSAASFWGCVTLPEYREPATSGIYGHAYSISPSTQVNGRGSHSFSVASRDGSEPVTIVVVNGNGYYRVDLPPGAYFIDRGDRDSLMDVVQVPPRQYVRMDLVLRR